MPLRPGERVGSYEVVRWIGAGGTAEVFEVRHTVLGSSHALKVLLPQWVEREPIRARFLQEGRIQASFDHPGLVRVTDTVAEAGIAGLVMELLVGESLRDHLEREGAVAPKEAVAWTIDVLDALAVAHAVGITHRDLKPENLFLHRGPKGTAIRVLDFGIAKGPEGQRTTQRGALGTCAYMSPEQVRDPSSVDGRTDVFAMGAVLWEMLVGRPAFEGATPFDSMQRVLSHHPGPPSTHRGGLPAWLDEVVEAALAKDPAERIASVASFADALRAGARGAELPARSPPKPAETKPKPRSGRSGPWMAVAIGVGVAGSLLLLGSLLAGIGLWAAVDQIERVDTVSVQSDGCGNTTVTAEVRASGSGRVAFTVDGAPGGDVPVQRGKQTVTWTTALEPGSLVLIEAELGGVSLPASHVVSGAPLGLVIEAPPRPRAGLVGRTRVRIDGSCVPPGAEWEARVGGDVRRGAVDGTGEIWLETGDLPEGSHLIEVRLIAPENGPTLATASHSLYVGEAPSAEDQDEDGYRAKRFGGDDCDDANPNVNPGVPESSAPNGVDDNCDGRVDEGTVAFDDDGDGFTELQGDCDDGDPATYPGARELPDCRDQDCDGEIDEGVQLPERDDPYEPNDTRARARDLKTSTKRSFSTDLALVARSDRDEAWFEFYSQDGDFDDWGIDVTAARLPANSSFRLEVFDAQGTSRGAQVASRDGDMLRVKGRWLRDDSGDYTLAITPISLYAPWCPYTIQLTSR